MEKENKKTVKILAAASFLNDFGSDIIYPVWPLFVKSLGANMTALGFIDGLGEAIVSISQAISGYLSDKFKKRKIFVWLGYLFGSISRIGYALSSFWQMLIPFRILDRFGKIRGAPRDAILADASSDENRGRNFGFLRAMDNLGAVFGILTSIFLFKILGYKKLFLLASIPSLISVFLILSFIKDSPPKEKRKFEKLSPRAFSKNYKIFLFLSSLFALGSFSYSFLLIFAKESGFKTSFVPVLYLIFTLSASISAFPFGKLADKIGRKKVIFLSFFFWLIVCLIFIFQRNFFLLLLAFILYGLHKGALEPSQKTFVSELSPLEFRASGLGFFRMITGLFALPSSFIAGILWDKVSVFAPFYFASFLTLISMIILMFVQEKVE